MTTSASYTPQVKSREIMSKSENGEVILFTEWYKMIKLSSAEVTYVPIS